MIRRLLACAVALFLLLPASAALADPITDASGCSSASTKKLKKRCRACFKKGGQSFDESKAKGKRCDRGGSSRKHKKRKGGQDDSDSSSGSGNSSGSGSGSGNSSGASGSSGSDDDGDGDDGDGDDDGDD